MPSGIITIGTAAFSRLVPVPRGRQFTIALRGTVGGATFKAQWYDGTNWNDFVSTDLSFDALGEATGTNVGSINEIQVVSTGGGSTAMIAVINVIPIEAHSM